METINTIELRDPSVFPDEAVLAGVLGESFTAYSKLLGLFDELGLSHEWRFYNDGKAWLSKVQKKKRTIVWMSAWKGYMQATVYFPEKYTDLVFGLDVSAPTLERIRNAKKVGKSTPCTFAIDSEGVLDEFIKVVQLKIETK